MRSVFVKAYTNKNLGDDLFLVLLFERYPNTQFILEADTTYNDVFSKYDNVVVWNRCISMSNIFYRILRGIFSLTSKKLYEKLIFKKLKQEYEDIFSKTDLYISIGGSIFMESNYGFSYDIAYNKFIVTSFNSKPKFFIGCNFGPFRSQSYKNEYQNIFSTFTDVSFRDEYSAGLFKKSNTIRCNPDLVFSFSRRNTHRANNSVGFAVRYLGEVNKEKFIDKHVRLISLFFNKGFKIKLFAFCENEGDARFANDLLDALIIFDDKLKDCISLSLYSGNIDEFLDDYTSVDFMVCERFHAMILSLVNGQKILPIMYSDKMSNVLTDMQFQGSRYSYKEFLAADINILVKDLLTNKYQLSEEIVKNSKNHFLVLDDFLFS